MKRPNEKDYTQSKMPFMDVEAEYKQGMEEYVKHLEKQGDELKLKVEELKEYAQHKPNCNFGYNRKCDCGLEQTLNE